MYVTFLCHAYSNTLLVQVLEHPPKCVVNTGGCDTGGRDTGGHDTRGSGTRGCDTGGSGTTGLSNCKVPYMKY